MIGRDRSQEASIFLYKSSCSLSRFVDKSKIGSELSDPFSAGHSQRPNYARAHAGLADSYALMSSYYLAPQDELIPNARVAALKALQVDDGLAEAHTSLAVIA